jgi:hypothetical protein
LDEINEGAAADFQQFSAWWHSGSPVARKLREASAVENAISNTPWLRPGGLECSATAFEKTSFSKAVFFDADSPQPGLEAGGLGAPVQQQQLAQQQQIESPARFQLEQQQEQQQLAGPDALADGVVRTVGVAIDRERRGSTQ